ncbi:hypothetical protein [Kribbella sp. DT2]|uniref:hypothetical protein n=1 Tax=Kribbella sp. DT2 TaxID=3393427 RepID=UPI003CFAD1DB
MTRKTPQEKKALSYAKDRRNSYGENDKASRKAIPLRKRLVNRANRHQLQQSLASATDAPDPEAVEVRALGKRPKRWKKWPDESLAEAVAYQLKRRAERQNKS